MNKKNKKIKLVILKNYNKVYYFNKINNKKKGLALDQTIVKKIVKKVQKETMIEKVIKIKTCGLAILGNSKTLEPQYR